MQRNSFYKNISQYRHNSVFIKFLLTFLALFIIPLLSVTIIYFNTYIGEMQKKILNSDLILLNRLVELTDEKVKSVEQSIINIILLDNTNTSMQLNDSKGQSRSILNATRESLHNLKISADIVDDIFIYYRNADAVVSTNAVYDFDIFFNSLQKYKSNNLESWKDFFDNNRYKSENVIPSMNVLDIYNNDIISSKTAMTFVSGINYYEKNPAVIYGIQINSAVISDMIKKLNITSKGYIYIANQENHIVTTTDINSNYASNINESFLSSLAKDSSSRKLEVGGKSFCILYAESTRNKLRYIALIPEDEIVSDSNFIMRILILLCLALVLFTGFSAIIISGRIYKPIYKLVELVSTGTGRNDEKGTNEFEYLSSNIDSMLRNTKSLNSTLKKSLAFSREKLLTNLVNGQYGFLENNSNILHEMNLHFNYPDFCVAVIKIDAFMEFKQKYNEFDRDLFKYCICNISEETSQPHGFCFSSPEDEIILLVNFDSGRQAENYLVNLAQIIKQNITEYLLFTVAIGIGEVKKDIHEISKSYDEACYALGCRKVTGSNELIEYEKAAFMRTEYYYPIDKERSIISYLKAGDYQNSIKVMEQIIDENFKMEITYHQLQYMFSELLSTILKAIYDLEGKIQDIFNIESLGKELFENETLKDTKDWFEKVCIRLCNYFKEQQESGNKELIQKILQYIQENYNKDITLETVADHFNISYSYLSRYYKQQTGANFIESLYELRMQKAREMLKCTSMKINQVAESVGYNNVNHFIKIFKKYEGVTPGKFRNTLK